MAPPHKGDFPIAPITSTPVLDRYLEQSQVTSKGDYSVFFSSHFDSMLTAAAVLLALVVKPIFLRRQPACDPDSEV